MDRETLLEIIWNDLSSDQLLDEAYLTRCFSWRGMVKNKDKANELLPELGKEEFIHPLKVYKTILYKCFDVPCRIIRNPKISELSNRLLDWAYYNLPIGKRTLRNATWYLRSTRYKELDAVGKRLRSEITDKCLIIEH